MWPMQDGSGTWSAPTGSPVGTTGWFLADDGRWYRSKQPPATGYWLAADGRWQPPDHASDHAAEPWRLSRWGLGDVWWGVLAYIVAGIVGALAIWAVTGTDQTGDETSPYALVAFVGMNAIAVFGVALYATRRKGLRSLRHDFGLAGRWPDVLIGLGLGIAGVIVAAITGFAIDTALGAEEQTSNLPVDALDDFGQFAAFFLAVAIITPIVEELFFRGLVYRSVRKRGRSVARSIFATTIIFVLPHLTAVDSWAASVSLFASIAVLGVTFNLACVWTGNRLAAPIVAHLVVNGLAAVALYVG
jgi:membrane protease YdiL (CAAX protease family)